MTLLMTHTAAAFDPDALTTLKKSVSEWNTMRLEKPGKYIDLYKAQLENANLTGANLSRTVLVRAELSGSTLNIADM